MIRRTPNSKEASRHVREWVHASTGCGGDPGDNAHSTATSHHSVGKNPNGAALQNEDPVETRNPDQVRKKRHRSAAPWGGPTDRHGSTAPRGGPTDQHGSTAQWGGSVDSPDKPMFASRTNTQLPVYRSWRPDQSALAVDALSISRKDHMFPPFTLIHRYLAKLREEKITALLVGPVRPNQGWFPQLLSSLVCCPFLLPPIYLPLGAWFVSGDPAMQKSFRPSHRDHQEVMKELNRIGLQQCLATVG